MYSNAKIPEPFCRREGGASAAGQPKPAVSAAETVASEKKQASGQQDSLPLLAFLLMELLK